MNIGGTEELKIFGIGPQLDLGNFTVGLATIFVAGVTLYIAFSNTKSTNNHKVAEFRQFWIDDLRSHIAEFAGCVDGALNHAVSIKEGLDRRLELDKQFSDIKRLESYIALKLNPNEKDHRALLALIDQTRGHAVSFTSECFTRLSDDTHLLIKLIVAYSQIILKTEWDRVRIETRGRRSFSEYLYTLPRNVRRWRHDKQVRAQVAKFFNERSIAMDW